MTIEELIDGLTIKVDGKKDSGDIIIFTLSTCMWCKKCKRWLNEQNVKYRYVDLDKISYSQKSAILDLLRKNYQERISYPFMIGNGDYVVGYDLNKFQQLLDRGVA